MPSFGPKSSAVPPSIPRPEAPPPSADAAGKAVQPHPDGTYEDKAPRPGRSGYTTKG